MTREEALETIDGLQFADACDIGNLYLFVNEIYDDFENRSCNSCKWWNSFNGVCCNGDSPLCADFVDCDFCCKYYERKEDGKNIK